jgi:hypothetical protein
LIILSLPVVAQVDFLAVAAAQEVFYQAPH